MPLVPEGAVIDTVQGSVKPDPVTVSDFGEVPIRGACAVVGETDATKGVGVGGGPTGGSIVKSSGIRRPTMSFASKVPVVNSAPVTTSVHEPLSPRIAFRIVSDRLTVTRLKGVRSREPAPSGRSRRATRGRISDPTAVFTWIVASVPSSASKGSGTSAPDVATSPEPSTIFRGALLARSQIPVVSFAPVNARSQVPPSA